MSSHDQSAETLVTGHGSVVNANDLLTVAEVVQRYELSESTLRRLLASKTLEAVQRKGPKGNYWLIHPTALGVLGYRPKPTEAAAAESALSEVETLRATLSAVQEAQAVTLEAERKAHAEVVERLTSTAAYEKQLREAAESKATLAEDAARLAATLAATTNRELEATRSRLLELESGPKTGKWWKRSKKQAPTTPSNG